MSFNKGIYMQYYNNYHSYGNIYWTKGVKTLVIANAVVFGIQVLSRVFTGGSDIIISIFGLSPEKVVHNFWLWQLITAAFLHNPDSLFHLLFNLLALFFFGHIVENHYNRSRFYSFYFLCAIFSSLIYTILHFIIGSTTIMIGASGAIMGILALCACISPNAIVYLYFVFPIRLRTLIWILIAIDAYMLIHPYGGVAASAHLGGVLFGYIYYHFSDKLYNYLEKIEVQAEQQYEEKLYKRDKNLREEVDRILEKIHNEGIHKLSAKEKKFLQNASKEYKKR